MSQTTKKIKKNVVVGILCRLAIMALGFIMPRLMLMSFGSEVNGLLSTVGQIFAYVSLLEAGIGDATLNALYRPLLKEDKKETTDILRSSRRLFRKTSLYFAIAVLALAVLFPFVWKTSIHPMTVAAIILLEGADVVCSYFFSAAYSQLLKADGRSYYLENMTLLKRILADGIKIVLIYLGADVIWLEVAYLLLALLRIACTLFIVRKKYPWLNVKTGKSNYELKERKAFVLHQIAGTVFSSTDVVVISSICGLAAASVYSVYNMIYSSLSSIISALVDGTGFVLGRAYHKGLDFYRKIYDIYDGIYVAFVFSMMTVACSLTLPFIRLYTEGITDVVYTDAHLPYLFSISAALSACRATASKTIGIAGHAGATQSRAILEAIINIVVSVSLVFSLGIHGALLGTIAALLYRVIDQIIYTNRRLLKRSCVKSFLFIVCAFLLNAAVFFILNRMANGVTSYIRFLIYGVLYLVSTLIVNGVFAVIFHLNKFRWLVHNYKGICKFNENGDDFDTGERKDNLIENSFHDV